MKTRKTLIAASALAISMAGLSSCNIYKKYETPDSTALTAEYKKALESEIDSTAFGNLRWQEVFTDPTLASLIDQALANNTNFKNAKLNVDIAHAQLKGAKLAYLPSVALAPSGQGSKFFTDPSQNMSWGYTIPLAVSWEIDVFAKLLNSKRGAQAAYEQSEAYRQATRSQIISSVATCYYTIAMLQAQLETSQSTAKLWEESVQTMKDLKEAGRLTEVAVVQSEAQYYGILASITDIEVSLHEMNNTMSLLLNVMPQKWAIPSSAVISSPAIVRESIPMRELASRPDVAAAERSLAVAYYSTNSARAAFYPGLSITANGGFTNMLGSAIINPGKFFINLAGSLTAPLFSRGQNIARLEAAKAQQEQAMNNFEYTLMSASAEVSDALTLYQKSVEKNKSLEIQASKLSNAVDFTQELLKLGSYGTTYLDVLTAQQGLLQAQISSLAALNAQNRALINLYQSLGGGR
ncbi:MAG: TolC family protein [Paramuribaculum sp.]|nr:TolC family protein [Paramuribaculum sp.]MDE6488950.1 TolC family protein [Paramuribaculum sp.]